MDLQYQHLAQNSITVMGLLAVDQVMVSTPFASTGTMYWLCLLLSVKPAVDVSNKAALFL